MVESHKSLNFIAETTKGEDMSVNIELISQTYFQLLLKFRTKETRYCRKCTLSDYYCINVPHF